MPFGPITGFFVLRSYNDELMDMDGRLARVASNSADRVEQIHKAARAGFAAVKRDNARLKSAYSNVATISRGMASARSEIVELKEELDDEIGDLEMESADAIGLHERSIADIESRLSGLEAENGMLRAEITDLRTRRRVTRPRGPSENMSLYVTPSNSSRKVHVRVPLLPSS